MHCRFLSGRGWVWTDVDKARSGGLPFVFEDNMSFERYVDYAENVPMYFVYRDGKYINALGQSWKAFMKGQLPALPGEFPFGWFNLLWSQDSERALPHQHDVSICNIGF